MRKHFVICFLGVLIFSVLCTRLWAVEGESAGAPAMTGSQDEYKDLEKTLKQDRMDTLEIRISDVSQENKFLAERVKMLERTVNDLKDKVNQLKDQAYRYN
ncbi:MAG TPA: hypothetical protein PLO78_08450 [Candidatus Omnitrophota bacterium]|nr:hypothetical protein [Candidatus Omnitrophota bacterium]